MNEWSVFICAETTEYHIHVFFFNDTATTEIYTLSLHDALPISGGRGPHRGRSRDVRARVRPVERPARRRASEACSGPRAPLGRSEEHTSELQSQSNLGCRLLLHSIEARELQPHRDRRHPQSYLH